MSPDKSTDASTKTYGLIGFPLGHSFSKQYFEQKFILENRPDCRYLQFPLQGLHELESIIDQYPDLCGFNVTIPYKQAILDLLDEIDPVAAAIGAVNTVRIQRNKGAIKLVGYNTDVYGFKEAIHPLLHPLHTHALVLGAGGASKAVLHALREWNIKATNVSRSQKHGSIIYNELNIELINLNKLIINATPIGMFPDIDAYPSLPYEGLSHEHLLFDLVYNPLETAFMQQGKVHGAQTENGLKMLHLQADRAWELWNS